MQGKRLWIIQKTRDYPLRKSKKIAQKRISRPICLTEPLDDKQKKIRLQVISTWKRILIK